MYSDDKVVVIHIPKAKAEREVCHAPLPPLSKVTASEPRALPCRRPGLRKSWWRGRRRLLWVLSDSFRGEILSSPNCGFFWCSDHAAVTVLWKALPQFTRSPALCAVPYSARIKGSSIVNNRYRKQ